MNALLFLLFIRIVIVKLLIFMARKSGTYFNVLNRVHYFRVWNLQSTPVDIVAFIGDSVLVLVCV